MTSLTLSRLINLVGRSIGNLEGIGMQLGLVNNDDLREKIAANAKELQRSLDEVLTQHHLSITEVDGDSIDLGGC